MGDVLINVPSSESKSRLSSASAKCNILYQLKSNDVTSATILNNKAWRYREILKFFLFILIFCAEPVDYYANKDENETIKYKLWLDILMLAFMAIIPFVVTVWLSYKSEFVKKVFPWTFCSELLLLLFIVIRSKLVFDDNIISWISIISYFVVQFYTYHSIIYIIPVENIISLVIYISIYSKEVFSDNENDAFLLGTPKFFFPIYLIIFTIINVLSKLNVQTSSSSNRLTLNTSSVAKDYDQCKSPAEKAMYICRVVMESPQIEQQDLMLLDKLQSSLLDKMIMKDKNSINEKKSRNVVPKYSIESTAVIENNEFEESYDVPKIEVVSPDTLNKLFCDIDSWDWNVFNYANVVNNPLYYLTRFFFERENLFSKLNIPEKEFNRFIGLIEKGYHDLPFHNKIHATDVLHGMNYLIKNPKIKAMCNTIDIMCCYIAAIIHDYDHPGFSNVYLVNIQDELAILYNDQRVLESHHLAKAWELLLKPENNFLKNFSKTDFLKIRKLIIELVLATDLSQHNQLLSSFRERVLSKDDITIDDDIKELILKIIIKFADVSNTSKAWSIYTYWFERVMTEFYRQGDHERNFGINISANMDRYNENAPLCQINFIKFICEPINTVVDTYLQDKVFKTNLNYNYKRLVKLEDSKKLKLAEKDSDVLYDDSE